MADANAPAQTNNSTIRPVQVKLVLLGEAAVGKSSVVVRFVQNDFTENKEPTIGAAFLTQKCRLEDKVIKFEIWDTAGQERFHSLAPMYYRNAQAAVVTYDVTKGPSLDKAKSWVKELQRQANTNIVIALIGNKIDLVSKSSDSITPTNSSQSVKVTTDGEQTSSSSPAPVSSSSSPDDEADDATATPDDASYVNGDGDSESTTVARGGGGLVQRQVAREEAEAYAKEAGLLFFETSAKTGEGVVEVFTEIARKIPIEHILSATRGAAGAGGRAGGTTGRSVQGDGRIQLSSNDNTKKDGCAC